MVMLVAVFVTVVVSVRVIVCTGVVGVFVEGLWLADAFLEAR
jgi:hypothetical protein